MSDVRYEVSVAVVRIVFNEYNEVVSDEKIWEASSPYFRDEETAKNLAREAMVTVLQALCL